MSEREVVATFEILPGERIVAAKTFRATRTGRASKTSYATRTGNARSVPVHVLITERTSRRGKVSRFASVACPDGIPFEGKWGPDAIYGLFCRAPGNGTTVEAFEHFLAEAREARNPPAWRPKRKNRRRRAGKSKEKTA